MRASTLRTRPRVVVDELRPGDTATVGAVLGACSPATLRLRFHAPVPTVSASTIAAIADGGTTLVARVRRTPVGLAQLVPLPAGRAETALVVADDWQGRGVGRQLVVALTEHARSSGVRRLDALVLAENGPMLHLLRSCWPTATIRRERDVVHVSAVVDGTDAWTMEVLFDELVSHL